MQEKKFNETEALYVINCLLQGVKSLVEVGIWHSDVKPSNILIENNFFKICDYGFTKIVECNPYS